MRRAGRSAAILLLVTILTLGGVGRSIPATRAAEASLVFSALQILTERHIYRPDPLKLLAAALSGLRKALAAGQVSDTLADLTATTAPEARREFQARFDQAAAAAAGRPSAAVLQYAAVRAMVGSIESSHNAFLDPDELEALRRIVMNEESYIGFGIRIILRDGKYYCREVVPDGPAARAGVRPLDRLLSVEGKTVTGLTWDELGSVFRAITGNSARMTLQRAGAGAPIDVRVTPGPVLVWTVDHALLEGGIGYVRLAHFSDDAGEEVRLAIEVLRDRGMRGLVLDLRDNPGGLISEMQQVANLLLPRGLVIAIREDRLQGRGITTTSGGPLLNPTVPLVVLVDEDTGSAAEILAAAIKDHGRGALVGTRTAGEVLESLVFILPGGAALLVPVRRVLTGRGVELEGTGVTPDVAVPLTADDLDRGIDAQLQRAVQLARQRAAYRPALPTAAGGAALIVSATAPRRLVPATE